MSRENVDLLRGKVAFGFRSCADNLAEGGRKELHEKTQEMSLTLVVQVLHNMVATLGHDEQGDLLFHGIDGILTVL